MKKKSQQKKESQKLSERILISSNFLADYVDVVVRGLIVFIVFGLLSYYIFYGWLELPIYVTLPIIFVLLVVVSPYLNKVKVGATVQDKYDEFLLKIIKWKDSFGGKEKVRDE